MGCYEGLLIKGFGSFYTVKLEQETVEARARGRLKKDRVRLLIGDRVVLEKEQDTYAIIDVLPRKNSLIRPAVANVDQILVVIAAASPDPNFKQTDKLLAFLEKAGLDVKICINKTDLACGKQFADIYRSAGYEVVSISTKRDSDFSVLKELLKDKITALAGCSGVGKSSLINGIDSSQNQTTGEVGKIARGRHTTTHASLIPLEFGGFIADTPGFSVVDISQIKKEELAECFREFVPLMRECRFLGCSHTKEVGCRILKAVEEGEIAKSRYESYLALYEELSALIPNYRSRKDSNI